ncbi:transcriptional regulator [Vineibacter terrae]|uniref:Transcriptional regulator n=1 Tax=Vineibacter terrae TaxID=2586908 RepID=A0A5C8PLW8_9HYPH|nr:type IV toxin-antitoxin system AbiEi family antitoxin [Vineibacter terrae]TXL75145.1 transcriptional regulator [Vineibacter terrae]
METNLRTLGPNETKVVLSFREQGREVVRAAEIIDLLGSEQTGRKVIRNLIRKGWLSRLVGGRYMLLPPEHGPENIGENNMLALASAVIEPSYVGWWSAAAFHGFTTQKPMAVTVAVLRQARARLIEGSEVRFVTIAEQKFFGFKSYNVYGRNVMISTPEKTVIDCIDRPELAGGPAELARIIYSAMSEIDAVALADAGLTMKSTSLLQRLGFLTDIVGKPLPEETRQRIRQAIPKSTRSTLGRPKRKEGDLGYVAAWGLFVNARSEDLLAEVPRLRSGKEA